MIKKITGKELTFQAVILIRFVMPLLKTETSHVALQSIKEDCTSIYHKNQNVVNAALKLMDVPLQQEIG
jgi:hypothetical protein